MDKYRKPDQEYYDRYDRHTIEWLKEIEKEETKEYPRTFTHEGKTHTTNYNPFIRFKDRGVSRAREREETVKKWMMEDENNDRLVENHKIPQGIKCDYIKSIHKLRN